jgi:hypothetical protein
MLPRSMGTEVDLRSRYKINSRNLALNLFMKKLKSNGRILSTESTHQTLYLRMESLLKPKDCLLPKTGVSIYW